MSANISLDHLMVRIRAEFREMPGLRLTASQAQRLWGLERDVCARVIDQLVQDSVLRRRGDTYSLAD